ncbi:hypothetical protein K402DRAFT_188738 [Aulographum hederae CBS 113979]|uniref:Uncharacterized protein n=1 Tax=Aulographum hederae CBS 113979 TaxID=1176131 RepID=A0A6G1GPI9_9PEZI|nr:hypothetical protein K402DRAFT_188738 [Aulographum hederae CBS 113979]
MGLNDAIMFTVMGSCFINEMAFVHIRVATYPISNTNILLHLCVPWLGTTGYTVNAFRNFDSSGEKLLAPYEVRRLPRSCRKSPSRHFRKPAAPWTTCLKL